MNKLVVFFVTFVAVVLNLSVEGQLTCFQGTRTCSAGVILDLVTSSACAKNSTICYRSSETATVLGVTGKKKVNAVCLV